MKLNLGCGDHKADGWVNIDSFEGVNPDCLCDVASLPFSDDSVEAIYCGHVFEHLSYPTGIEEVLREIKRVLKDDGNLCVVGPDIDLALALHMPESLIDNIVNGEERWPGDKHQWLSTGLKTHAVIWPHFPSAHLVDISTIDDEWPIVSKAPWQFAILA